MPAIPVRAGQTWALVTYRPGARRHQTLEVLELRDDGSRALVRVTYDSDDTHTGVEREISCDKLARRCHFRSGEVPVTLTGRQLDALRAVQREAERREQDNRWPYGATAGAVTSALDRQRSGPQRSALRSTLNTLSALQRKGLLVHSYERYEGNRGYWHLTYAGEALLAAQHRDNAVNPLPATPAGGTPPLRRPSAA